MGTVAHGDGHHGVRGAKVAQPGASSGNGLVALHQVKHVVREELAGTCEVGFAFFDPDPEDEYSSIKRIEWDPDAPGAQWPPGS